MSPVEVTAETVAEYNRRARELYEMLPWEHPTGIVQWVHTDEVEANGWNPNSVPHKEMTLLHTSISEDGLTQPTVVSYDEQRGKYVVIDGFHRYTVMRRFPDIYDSTGGYLPVVVLDKTEADMRASTVRHNRARGKHSVGGMSNLVFEMLQEGESDATICHKLGMEAEELARLKHLTGYSKLYADAEHSSPVLSRSQMEAKADYKRKHPDEPIPTTF